ncbi:hypothetical protein MIND_00740600 [Mycena indigotica]|uniref:Gfd2/YDR514C-like C-terminal domain-containing protein n=1 Tax=Mycena indigotica TaxID=2126181 RepID=A0A8H6SPS7_9AGAR|nr:uncharacterized protein MIND_00740600 [Mycena indigotica]KAF7301750.1 hypothetical protein MIND_00740600 [Mycena indigotica]
MVATLSGWIRCTDILFHYHSSLKDTRDGVSLQKILDRDSLLHSRHPLASDKDGKPGIQAYVGTFHDGQARLLFSSAQVDYLRYWMHQMRLTTKLIPLPYSNCMFLNTDIASIEPTVFADLSLLSETSKVLSHPRRMNTHLRANPLLVNRRSVFEHLRGLWAAKKGVWCALNIDAWERDHTVISDVGWTWLRWDSGSEMLRRGHLVVTKNQTYAATSLEDSLSHEFVTINTLKQKLQSLFTEMQQNEPIFLISSDAQGTMRYLQSQLRLNIPSTNVLPCENGTGMYIVDYNELFNALIGRLDHEIEPKPLERVCHHLKLPFKMTRNAGVDSETCLDIVRSMVSGPKLDLQREARWPLQLEVQVQFPPWEEDPNYADLEGVIPPKK